MPSVLLSDGLFQPVPTLTGVGLDTTHTRYRSNASRDQSEVGRWEPDVICGLWWRAHLFAAVRRVGERHQLQNQPQGLLVLDVLVGLDTGGRGGGRVVERRGEGGGEGRERRGEGGEGGREEG